MRVAALKCLREMYGGRLEVSEKFCNGAGI
jgi:hypothetical protein